MKLAILSFNGIWLTHLAPPNSKTAQKFDGRCGLVGGGQKTVGGGNLKLTLLIGKKSPAATMPCGGSMFEMCAKGRLLRRCGFAFLNLREDDAQGDRADKTDNRRRLIG